MMQQGEEEFALFVGGLRRDRKISFLKRKLIELFNDCLGISLAPADVNIVAPPGQRFAFVYLASTEEMEIALTKLASPVDRATLAFNFDEIQSQTRGLSVQIKFSTRDAFLSQVSPPCGKLGQDLLGLKHPLKPIPTDPTHRPHGSHVSDSTVKGENSNSCEQKDQAASLSTQTPTNASHNSTSASAFKHANTSTTNLFHRSKIKRKMFENATTSTTGLISPESSTHSLPDKYLITGHYLGNETRNVEFKRGGGQYMKKQLREHVAKYVCCFLNAGEGGSLFIGVDDNGAVQGVECNNRQENDYRLLIDDVIKGISPQVFPQQYSVSFVPVLERDQEHLTPIANVHVIEIHVEAVGRPERLYETHRGDVYIRRDGSVQGPLRASDIQEWTRMMHRREENGCRGELHRLQDEIDSYRQREAELRDEHGRLMAQVQQLRQQLPPKHVRSKSCLIL